ncbi:MAG TPA: PhaM family polyhydroxyalkanoate granule multifunctional regulatory protein [Usitatibacter sp.]|nr:PhaM family polyhydroxyalkanoate granule multifunctional regulatory protein [Usitatibacter sp.]
MTKPVTPQELFDLWQKMVNPGAFPLQSLMFPVLDAREIEKKIAELETVEHWLKANLSMLQLSIKSLEYQRALLQGGEKAAAAMQGGEAPSAEAPNPALWAWNMMAQAGRQVMDQASKAASESAGRKRGRKRGDPAA